MSVEQPVSDRGEEPPARAWEDACERACEGPGRLRVVHGDPGSLATLEAALAAHRRALAQGTSLLQQGPRNRVTRVRLAGSEVCVKEYRAAGRLDRLKDHLRAPRAERAWRAAAYLIARGVATPEPLALVEEDGARHFVTRFVERATRLDQLLARRFAAPRDAGQLAAKRALLSALGRWLRRIHDLGIYHGDWSAKNVLAVEGGGGEWEFLLLDLESLAPRRRLTRRRRAKNLAQLADPPAGLTRTDLMRFLAAYAGGQRQLARGAFPRAVLTTARRRRQRRERRERLSAGA